MDTLKINQYGYGIEQEGWICDKTTGKPVASINGNSAYLALKQQWTQNLGCEPECLSPELLSCQAEIKTTVVHSDLQDALLEIEEHVESINQALKMIDPNLVFETTAYKDMSGVKLIAADPSAASYKRFKEWSLTEKGKELLRSTAICSTQLCVSKGLDRFNVEQRETLLSRAYAYLTQHYNQLQEINHRSPRLEIVEGLIIEVKKNNFDSLELLEARDLTWITRPDGTDLQRWYMAHSGVSELSQIQSKDAHGLLLKGKTIDGTMDLVCMEHRWADAQVDINKCVSNILDVHNRMMDSITK